ncbi:MAG TPA: prepilin-type N-terminal cleavage/methylation domain-containing protein, partial [Armatimonadota bacterium]|nr:prepilin-type N-terminal cleavage/methylation domain-containing protein [Armatimonadota bacterium]
MRKHFNRRRGFTLVELLVVLAILVLLFGLLFAPMMTSLDMAKSGQARAGMQDTVRYMLEDIRRTIGNAVQVLPMQVVVPASQPGAAYVNLSTLMTTMPQVNASGLLMSPLQPTTTPDPSGTNQMVAIRYIPHPKSGRIIRYDDTGVVDPPGATVGMGQPSSGLEYAPTFDDPFVLYRQTGLWFYHAGLGRYVFGSFNSAGQFATNQPITENALSMGRRYDIRCTASVCDNCGFRHPGYRPYTLTCSNCAQQLGYTFLHEGVQFAPQQTAGEQLEPLRDGTVYSAKRGGWTGYAQTDPTIPCPQLFERSLDPRVVVNRIDDSSGSPLFIGTEFDSHSAALRGAPALNISWDPETGAVRFGRQFRQVIRLTDNAGQVQMAVTADEANVASLDALPSPMSPTGYSIDTTPAAIILPSTIRVRVIVNLQAGGTRWWDLVETNQLEQSQIGPNQFASRRVLPPVNWRQWIPDDWATGVDILLPDALAPRDAAPGPPRFTAWGLNVASVDIVVTYWGRRNADIH